MDYFHYLDTVAGYNLFQDGRPIRREGYFTDLLTDEAIDFLQQAQPATSRSFSTSPTPPRIRRSKGPTIDQPDPLPLDSPLWNQGKAPPDVYIAMIEHMDRAIGDLLDDAGRARIGQQHRGHLRQ